jgi:hypothetical protein
MVRYDDCGNRSIMMFEEAMKNPKTDERIQKRVRGAGHPAEY